MPANKNSLPIETLLGSPEYSAGDKNWGKTTDPRDHNPTDFRYLVHSVTNGTGINAPSLEMGRIVLGKKSKVNPVLDINGLSRISSSLVDVTHPATFVVGRWGLILNAGPADIVAVAARDIGSAVRTADSTELSSQFPIINPDELLAQSNPNYHNEVVLRGGAIEVVGIYYLQDAFPQANSHQIDQDFIELQTLGKQNQLPIVGL